MIFLIGITIAFFLEFILLGKKQKLLVDRILIIWLFIIGIHQLLFYLRYTQKSFDYPFVLGLDLPLPLVHGPLLLLYVAALTNRFPNGLSYFWHFLPVMISYLCMIPFFILPGSEKVEVFRNQGKGFELFSLLIFITIVISGITYFIWSTFLLKQHAENIKNIYSNTKKISLNWLRYLIYGIGVIYLISFFLDEVFIFSAIVIFVLFVGYFGIRQVGIFSPFEFPDKAKADENEIGSTIKKYSKSGLSETQIDKIFAQLTYMMEKEEIYKNSEIDLVELAKIVDIHPNYLSQVINEKTGNNFYTYINNLRIEAFIKLVKQSENQNLKLIAIAYDCGFNSKSSFNKYFKLFIGTTPSEYLSTLK